MVTVWTKYGLGLLGLWDLFFSNDQLEAHDHMLKMCIVIYCI